ncbi:MAG: hypothetical protein L7G90_02750 [Candidatus Nanopusillus sp.]|nr:hypothetical protein [Candidatus Nanopusillus sp.]
MKGQRNKYIELRIPSKYKSIFYEKRELIKQEIDKILNGEKEFKLIESQDNYDERVFFTVDDLYYDKLLKLSEKYNIKPVKIIRSIFLNLI